MFYPTFSYFLLREKYIRDSGIQGDSVSMSWLRSNELEATLSAVDRVQCQYRLQCALNTPDLLFNSFQNPQILNFCCPSIGPSFGGVFPCDKLPNHTRENVCYIFNTAPSHKKGEHWVAYYQTENTSDFFDSYGAPLYAYPAIGNWVRRAPTPQLSHLSDRIQGPSALCGAYCLYFLT